MCAPLDDAQPVVVQLQVRNDLGLQQAHGVGGGRVTKARMEFLGDASAPDHTTPLENADAQSRHRQIGRAGETIVAGADYDRIEIRHGFAFGGIASNTPRGSRRSAPRK